MQGNVKKAYNGKRECEKKTYKSDIAVAGGSHGAIGIAADGVISSAGK